MAAGAAEARTRTAERPGADLPQAGTLVQSSIRSNSRVHRSFSQKKNYILTEQCQNSWNSGPFCKEAALFSKPQIRTWGLKDTSHSGDMLVGE